MPRTFTQKVITKLQVYIEQCQENNEYIYGSNELRITEKTIASLRNNRVIVSKINEARAREIIHQEFKHQFQEMIRRITEKMKITFPNIPRNYPAHGSKLSRTSTSCTKIQPQTSTSTNIINKI